MRVRPCPLLFLASAGSRPGISCAFTPAVESSPSPKTDPRRAARQSLSPADPCRPNGPRGVRLRASAEGVAIPEPLTPYHFQRALLEERLRTEGGAAAELADSSTEPLNPYQLHRALLEERLRTEGSAAVTDDGGVDDDEAVVVVMSRKAALDSPLAEAISSFVGEEDEESGEEAQAAALSPSHSTEAAAESDDEVGLVAAEASPKSREKQTAKEIGDSAGGQTGMLTHSDIVWKLRSPRDTPRLKKISLKLAANLIRLDCKLKREQPPKILCPKGGQAVLEAYYKEPGKRRKRIARFGITTERGPRSAEIDETVAELFDAVPPLAGVGVAAIIYMFVEPEFRGRGIGELALEAISAIHTVQGCDFTVLVADDDGSGKLVEWYEANGFTRAPKLQSMMGSPDGKFGTTMISPTSVSADFFEKVKIKWW